MPLASGLFLLTGLLAEPATWAYEGLITRADPSLAPDLKSGWVLSGSFILDPLEMEEEPPLESGSADRLVGGISSGELTVDLYHQIHFEALQVPGLAGFDTLNDDPGNDGRDLLSWFFPMRGKLKESEWSLRWLQVWLADPGGRMVRVSSPPVPPDGFSWEQGWFRMTFTSVDGEVAYAEGNLEAFAPAAALDDEGREGQWANVVAGLGRELRERDKAIVSLRGELAAARARLEGLRRMVDLMIEERSYLEEENARLQDQARLASPETEQRLAEITSEKALLEQELEDLGQRNQALAESLGESEFKRRGLLDRISELEAALQPDGDPEPVPSRPVAQGKVTTADGREAGSITVFEKPVIVEKPVPVAAPAPGARVHSTLSRERDEPRRSRRFGPRKFR